MTSATEVLTVRLPSGTKARLASAARTRNTTSAALVNALLLALVDDESENAVVPDAHRLDLRRAEFCIPEFLRDALRKRAAEEGFKPARWVSLLVQSNLMQGSILTDVELLAVKEASRELAALERSLNKAAQASKVACAPRLAPESSDRGVAALHASLHLAVESLRSRIDELVIRRSRAWGLNDSRA